MLQGGIELTGSIDRPKQAQIAQAAAHYCMKIYHLMPCLAVKLVVRV